MNEAAHTVSLISPSKSSSSFNTSNSEPETRFVSGMEWDLSRSIRHQEMSYSQPENFGSMDCGLGIQLPKGVFMVVTWFVITKMSQG